METRPIVVVGAGIIGTSIALRLVGAGRRVLLIEAQTPGAEASSAAAGMLGPQKEALGPGPLLDLCLRSRGLYRAFVEEVEALSGLRVAYEASGLLELAFEEATLQKLEAKVAWQRAVGLRAELLDVARARELEPPLPGEVLGAAHFPDDHQVDNQQLMRALAKAAQVSGVQLRTGRVQSLILDRHRVVGLELENERLDAELVVLAAGAWSSQISHAFPSFARVQPVRGQMVRLSSPAPLPRHLLSSPEGYLVPRKDGQLLAGSTTEFVGDDKAVTVGGVQGILNMATKLWPPLASARLLETWAGLRPWTEDGLPILGPGPAEGLFYATAHYRNGILLAPLTARVLAECVMGQKPSVDLHPFRFDRFSQVSSEGWKNHLKVG